MSIAKYIDYTLLKATATGADVERMCLESQNYRFASICIQPVFVALCKELLAGSGVGVTTVVGFPFGAAKPSVKAFEAEAAIADGASEIDMVMNIGEMLAGNEDKVAADIAAVSQSVAGHGLLKVIIETAYLSAEQILAACKIAKASGAQFIKTSTGYAPSGASAAHIRLIRGAVGPDFGIKASGGIGDYAKAKEMLLAGATRLGASAAVKIIEEEQTAAGN